MTISTFDGREMGDLAIEGPVNNKESKPLHIYLQLLLFVNQMKNCTSPKWPDDLGGIHTDFYKNSVMDTQ